MILPMYSLSSQCHDDFIKSKKLKPTNKKEFYLVLQSLTLYDEMKVIENPVQSIFATPSGVLANQYCPQNQ